jgi:succinate dehydrogenase / fumarate reductase flavoprotein subunit
VDTIKGGDYLSDQPPIKNLCEEAPGLIRAYDRMGVTFSRTAEGSMDQRLFGGVKNRRTAFAGATTGQQLLYAADEQVRAHEANGAVSKYENWDFLSLRGLRLPSASFSFWTSWYFKALIRWFG